jgi:pilus assembly protein CpaE
MSALPKPDVAADVDGRIPEDVLDTQLPQSAEPVPASTPATETERAQAPASHDAGRGQLRAPLPHLTVHCFLIDEGPQAAFERYKNDRLMAHTRVEIVLGGVEAAAARYAASKTPDLIFLEIDADKDRVLLELDRLAEVCDPGTKVVVLGRRNDVAIYRAVTSQGVADYLVAPYAASDMLDVTGRLFLPDGDAQRLGRVIAFLPAKGGCGASTFARNVAWSLAETGDRDVALLDFDLSFGDDALACNVESRYGVSEALSDMKRLDAALLEHFFVKQGARLSMLTAPTTLPTDAVMPSPEAIEKLITVARGQMPLVVLDLPHLWTPWVVSTLRAADAVAIVTTPTLSSLRNTGMLMEALKQLRPNDPAPIAVLNQTGQGPSEVPKKQRAAALTFPIAYEFAFEKKHFGEAEFEGVMLRDRAPQRVRDQIDALARALTGEDDSKGARGKAAKRGLFGRLLRRG